MPGSAFIDISNMLPIEKYRDVESEFIERQMKGTLNDLDQLVEINELIIQIQEAATEVYAALSAGHQEIVYERAMAREFRVRGIKYDMEACVEIFYKGEYIGDSRLDFLVDDKLVLELKSVSNINKSHVAQTQAYMRGTKIRYGVLVNFPTPLKEVPQFEMFGTENGEIDSLEGTI